MKNTIILALTALSLSASAATISWGFGGKMYLSDNGSSAVLSTSYSGTVPYTLVLVYVGQDATSYNLADIKAENVLDSMDYAVTTSGTSAAKGKWNPNAKSYITTAYENGASFAVLLRNGDNFYNVLSGTETVGAALTPILKMDNMSAQGSGTIYATGGSSVTGIINVAAVPEPATGALALAGIALLFKRRKARA